jgi:hypothetical protein
VRISKLFNSTKPYIVGNLYFTLGTSFVTGASNSVASIVRTDVRAADYLVDFFHAAGGNLGFGLLVNFIPATFNLRFAHRPYYWLSGNLMMLGMNGLMLWFQFLIQTENPIESRLLPTITSQIMENILIVKGYKKRFRG